MYTIGNETLRRQIMYTIGNETLLNEAASIV